MTPIDVLDSAVKIGLGALISGLAAYWIAKTNHNKTLERERTQRRCDLLEVIAQQVSAFNQIALKHRAYIANWDKFTAATEQMTDTTKKELLELAERLTDARRELTDAEGKLLLIGEVKCQRLLKEYKDSTRPYKEIINRESIYEGMEAYKEGLRQKHEAFFTELSNVYKRT
jgi:hypothetical protein